MKPHDHVGYEGTRKERRKPWSVADREGLSQANLVAEKFNRNQHLPLTHFQHLLRCRTKVGNRVMANVHRATPVPLDAPFIGLSWWELWGQFICHDTP